MPVTVSVHESVFPEVVRRGLLEGLRSRAIAPRYHYESYKQAQRWLAVHAAHSPAKLDPDCIRIYDEAFKTVAVTAGGANADVHLIGLGCGGGHKEARLLRALATGGVNAVYSPCDVSLALVLESRRVALEVVPRLICQPLLCDLTEAKDLPRVLDDYGYTRLVTLFGLIPNIEPNILLSKASELARPGDILLLSANLAPGTDYVAGVKKVMPGYDNPETRLWLSTLLYDFGLEPGDGEIGFSIEETAAGFLRIVADYQFAKDRSLVVEGEQFSFRVGDKIRLFFSFRYTPAQIVKLLSAHGLEAVAQWVTASGEEGVFRCRKTAG